MKTKKSDAFNRALAAIDEQGALLIFPMKNKKEPKSIWSVLHPRSEMRWEWDENGDGRVAELWHMREELSRSGKVVYSKWYQGRATVFSKEVFQDLLSYFQSTSRLPDRHTESGKILELLRSDSPLSTKVIKLECGLQGKLLESTFNRAMKPLWQRLQIVGYGEFQDSSFPSLGIGATELLFEDLWHQSKLKDPASARDNLTQKLGPDNVFLKFAEKST